jgi:hypothetical protein
MGMTRTKKRLSSPSTLCSTLRPHVHCEYGIGLSPNEPNLENPVKDLVSLLPVLAYDGAIITQIDAGCVLAIAMEDSRKT